MRQAVDQVKEPPVDAGRSRRRDDHRDLTGVDVNRDRPGLDHRLGLRRRRLRRGVFGFYVGGLG